ncbi:basic proline-rich protein-like [Iris pallida]|uniref:Basic proline-rich protein-like n=1 Tax=Iris pallida TaxID=29817 RepID=A0AAX6E233_IRIPA|nr:basic proline-rich protein-like [Iris pallida]
MAARKRGEAAHRDLDSHGGAGQGSGKGRRKEASARGWARGRQLRARRGGSGGCCTETGAPRFARPRAKVSGDGGGGRAGGVGP